MGKHTSLFRDFERCRKVMATGDALRVVDATLCPPINSAATVDPTRDPSRAAPRCAILAGVALAACLALAASPVPAQVRMEERDGTLYVSNEPARAPQAAVASRRAPAMPAFGPHQVPLAPREVSPYRALIEQAAQRQGLSPRLVEAVIRVESNFDPRAVSPKGARGLMQLMPATAAGLGVANAFSPKESIEGGVRHLRDLLVRFDGDLPLALAAYNAGADAVARHHGIPPFRETRVYIGRILGLLGEHARADRVPPSPLPDEIRSPAAAVHLLPKLSTHVAGDGALVYTNLPEESLPPRDRVAVVRPEPAAVAEYW